MSRRYGGGLKILFGGGDSLSLGFLALVVVVVLIEALALDFG